MDEINTTSEQPVVTQSEVDHIPSQTEIRHNQERGAFIRQVQDSGETIPDNFQNAGAWFDSLKEAQKQYTQGQQEIAELKDAYNINGVENPNYVEPTEAAGEPEVVAEPAAVETLKVEETPEVTDVSTDVPDTISESVSVGEWNDWGNIIDANNGVVPDPLRNAIKTRLGVDDIVIDDYINQRQQVQKQHVQMAADTVGGQAELNKIMDWASRNLEDNERMEVNGLLTGPGYKTAILGLKARYDNDSVGGSRSKEPSRTPNRQQSGDAVVSVTPYRNQNEMFADQRNPRYRTDTKYRVAVEQRMIATSKHGYVDA